MKARYWTVLCVAALFALSGSAVRAQDEGNGHGHGHGHDKDKHRDKDYHSRYDDHDRGEMRSWYHDHEDRDDLPPGLAKRDRLPPGLERQLVVRGTLPRGLRGRIEPIPDDLERRLPPPPPDYEHVAIGGHIVLMNRRTFFVLDIFHAERD